MNISLKKLCAVLGVVGLAFGTVSGASAVTVDQDITITTTGGDSLLLGAGSSFTTLTVQGGGFEFILGSANTITLRSNSKKVLTNTFGVSTTCGDTYSEVILSGSKGGTVGVVVESSACSGSGGGGNPPPSTDTAGSSGGGGGGSVTTTTTTTTTSTSTPATTATSTPSTTDTAPSVPESASPSTPPPPIKFPGVAMITTLLKYGSSGESVTALQEALASMPDVYPEGKVTGYFGPATLKAVQRFQMKYGVVASESETGYGLVGPKTRAKLAEVFGGGSQSTQTSSTAPTTGGKLTRELDMGASGDDVTQLQIFLAADPVLYPEGKVTGYYGPATTAAVKRFQAKHGISQLGRVGPATMAKLNELMGGGTSSSGSQSSSATTGSSDATALQSQLQSLQAMVDALNAQLKAKTGY